MYFFTFADQTVDFRDFIMKLLLAIAILFVLGAEAIKVKDKDMMRKMIIYDKVNGKFVILAAP